MNEILDPIIQEAAENDTRETCTDASGIERCAVCGEPVRQYIEAVGKVVPVRCACYDRADAERKRAEQIEAVRKDYTASRFYDLGYARCTFGADRFPDSEASRLCRAFVDRWEEMEANNYGLLLLGALGTGKSFYAASIVNALVDNGVAAAMVSTSRLISMTDNGKDTPALLEEMGRARLLVLDDLGAERETDFALEQLELFIDARSLAGRPLIVTTNYTKQELDSLADRRKARIFDRVKAMCCMPVILTGTSRRVDSAKKRARECRKILTSGRTMS